MRAVAAVSAGVAALTVRIGTPQQIAGGGPPPVTVTVTTTSLPNATVSAPYSATLTATGGAAPYTWSATGVPAGFTLSTAGVLSGTGSVQSTSTIVVTATDLNSVASAATSLSFNVVTGTVGLALVTANVGIGTVGVPLSTQIAATGGSGNYSFSLSTPFSPSIGLSLSSAGVITGTPTTVLDGNTTTPKFCTFGVTVTDTASSQTISRSYSLPIMNQPPLTYAAPTDYNVRPEPAIPAVTVGQIFTDDISGMRMLRITDQNTNPNHVGDGWINGDGSAETARFSALSTYVAVASESGSGTCFFQINRPNFTCTKITPNGQPIYTALRAVTWDPVIDTLAWGMSTNAATSFDVVSGVQTIVWYLASQIASFGETYLNSLSIADNGNMAALLGRQDVTPGVAVYLQGVTHVLDCSKGTLDGVAIPNWPSFSPATIHNVRMGQDGRHVKLTPSVPGNKNVIWDTATNDFTLMSGNGSPYYLVGHQGIAWGRMINNVGANTPGTFASQALIRDITTAAGAASPSLIFTVTGQSTSGAGDCYTSWPNQRQGMNVPYLETDNGFGWRTGTYPNTVYPVINAAHIREILAVATDGSAKVYRICHNFGYANIYPPSVNENFYDEVFGTISRDGNYAMFCSTWGNTLGLGNQYRHDCFLVELVHP